MPSTKLGTWSLDNSLAEIIFDGMLDPASLFDRLSTKFVQSQTDSLMGDFRDWNKIRGWAQTVFA